MASKKRSAKSKPRPVPAALAKRARALADTKRKELGACIPVLVGVLGGSARGG